MKVISLDLLPKYYPAAMAFPAIKLDIALNLFQRLPFHTKKFLCMPVAMYHQRKGLFLYIHGKVKNYQINTLVSTRKFTYSFNLPFFGAGKM